MSSGIKTGKIIYTSLYCQAYGGVHMKSKKGIYKRGIKPVSKQFKLAELLDKHQDSILTGKLDDFYADVIKSKTSFKDVKHMAEFSQRFKGIEWKDYEKTREDKGAFLLNHHLISNHACELAVREHFLNKLEPNTAVHLRTFITDSEKELAKQVIGKSVALHEDPAAHTEIKQKIHNMILEQPKKYLALKTQHAKKQKQLIETAITRSGENILQTALPKLKEEFSRKQTIYHSLEHEHSAALYMDVGNYVMQPAETFAEKAIQPLEEYQQQTRK